MLLQVDDLAVSFGGIRAVDGVTFSVEAGEILAIIGPNGAGKTTVFNLISRIYAAARGRIHFAGHDITRTAPHRLPGLGIGRTFQNIELFDSATVFDNLLLGCHRHQRGNLLAEILYLPSVRAAERAQRERVERVMDLLQLDAHRDLPVDALPYGLRKVVELARALCAAPTLLLLDEPSSGLNAEETDRMAAWIRTIRDRIGVAVAMIEHDMRLVAGISDRVLVLNQGQVLAQGSAAQMQANPDVIKAYLGG